MRMKGLFLILFCYAGTANAKCLMEHLMITGASSSAGLDGISFGDHLSEKYGKKSNLLNEAYPGVTGETITTYPSFSRNIKSASLVLALDFFYWDQFFCEGKNWEKNIDKTVATLFGKSVKKGIPLVVGNLTSGKDPFSRMRFESTCAEVINQKIKSACERSPKKCLFVDNDEVSKFVGEHFSADVEGLSDADKIKYTRKHITRDGVHPRTEAYQVIATYLDQTISASSLECK